MSFVSLVASALGAINALFKAFMGYQQKKMGSVETAYEAAKDARRRAELRRKVGEKIRTLSPNELSTRLRDRVRKSRFGND